MINLFHGHLKPVDLAAFIFFMMLSVLGGCSSMEEERTTKVPITKFALHRSNYMAVVYFYQKAETEVEAETESVAEDDYSLRVNNRLVATIGRGEYVKVFLAPGRYRVQLAQQHAHDLEVAAKDIVFIAVEELGERVPRDVALPDLVSLREREPLIHRLIDPRNKTFGATEWYLYRRKNTVAAYRQYIKLARTSPYINRALWRIQDLEAFREAIQAPAANRSALLRQYLDKFPQGTKRQLAFKLLPEGAPPVYQPRPVIKQKTLSPNQQRQEVIAYEQAIVMNSVNAYLDYLKLFSSQGKHVNEVYRRLMAVVTDLPLEERREQEQRIFALFPRAKEFSP